MNKNEIIKRAEKLGKKLTKEQVKQIEQSLKISQKTRALTIKDQNKRDNTTKEL